MIKTFLKDYGVLVGSFIGFFFTVLALFVKYWFDLRSNKWNTRQKIKKLHELIKKYNPPIEKNEPFIISEEISIPPLLENIGALKSYEHNIEIILMFIKKIEEGVLNYCDIITIENFFKLTNEVNRLIEILRPLPADNFDDIKKIDELNTVELNKSISKIFSDIEVRYLALRLFYNKD